MRTIRAVGVAAILVACGDGASVGRMPSHDAIHDDIVVVAPTDAAQPTEEGAAACPPADTVVEYPWVRPIPIVAVGDMRGQYVRLFLGEINADAEHPVTYARFRLHEIYRCGEHLVPWHATSLDLCDIVACETLRVSWMHYASPENDGIIDGTLFYADATPLPHWIGDGPDDDMSDFAFFAEQLIDIDRPQIWVTIVAQVRDDAPGGRFQLWLDDMRWGDYGSLDPLDRDVASHHHLHGLPTFGTDFVNGTMVEFPDCSSDTVSAVAGPDGF